MVPARDAVNDRVKGLRPGAGDKRRDDFLHKIALVQIRFRFGVQNV